jgi:hypothetical protein
MTVMFVVLPMIMVTFRAAVECLSTSHASEQRHLVTALPAFRTQHMFVVYPCFFRDRFFSFDYPSLSKLFFVFFTGSRQRETETCIAIRDIDGDRKTIIFYEALHDIRNFMYLGIQIHRLHLLPSNAIMYAQVPAEFRCDVVDVVIIQ